MKISLSKKFTLAELYTLRFKILHHAILEKENRSGGVIKGVASSFDNFIIKKKEVYMVFTKKIEIS